MALTFQGLKTQDEVRFSYNSQKRRVERQVEVSYGVSSTSIDTTGEQINALIDVPSVGDFSATYVGLRCLSSTPMRSADNPYEWTVRVTWGQWPSVDEDEDDNWELAPWLRPDRFSSSTEYVEREMAKDRNDDLIANTVDERIPYRHSIPVRVYTVERASLTWSESTADTYVGTTNSGAVTIKGISRAIDTLLMTAIDADEEEYDQGGVKTRYYNIVFQIRYDPNGHQLELLNEGIKYRKTAGGDAKDWDPATRGIVKNLASNGTLATSGSEHYVTFDVFESVSWSSLGFS